MSQQVKVYRSLDFHGSGQKMGIRYADVEITSAELLAMYTSGKTLVAAPGANKALEFVALFLAYDATSTAYTVGSASSYRVRYNGQSTNISTTASPTGFIDQTTDQVRICRADTAAGTPFVNTALILAQPGADPTTGTGVMHAHILYRVWETGL